MSAHPANTGFNWNHSTAMVNPCFPPPLSKFGGNWSMQPWSGPSTQIPISPFGDVGSDFGQMFMNMQQQMERNMRQMDRQFSSELNFQPSRPASMLEHYSLMNPIRMDASGNRLLNVYFDLRSYKPEEVSVSIDSKNRSINVEASHEVKDSKDHYIKRHYSRRVYLPEDIKVDLSKVDVKSCLTNDGLLCVEGQLPKLSIEEARAGSATGKTVSTTGPYPGSTVYPISVKTI